MSSSLPQRQHDWLISQGGKPALVVVDVQYSFADPAYLAPYGLSEDDLAEVRETVDRIGALVTRARELAVPVVWVELGSDPARPWRASNWLRGVEDVDRMAPDEPCIVGTEGARWYGMSPVDGDLRIIKPAYSGFVGTDLESHLRADGIGWLTVVGLTSECCVFATAQDAMQREWPVVIPRDGTTAYDRGVHEAALAQLALNVALVSDIEEVIGLWQGARA